LATYPLPPTLNQLFHHQVCQPKSSSPCLHPRLHYPQTDL